MQKSYKGVELQHRCEGITVSRRTRRVVATHMACLYPKAPRPACWGVHQASLTLPECAETPFSMILRA
eukprot:5379279-Prymnesium_polylepis.1